MPGPLPDSRRRRRNAPTIPTTNLPVSGRKGAAPKPPSWVQLGGAGTAWWKWAWKTPQACAWGPGHTVMIARRASLEDDLFVLGNPRSLDLVDMLEAEHEAQLKELIQRLAGLVSGRLAICREMRELDDRLGLTPKGMAALRWTIVADPAPAAPASPPPSGGKRPVTDIGSRRARLTG